MPGVHADTRELHQLILDFQSAMQNLEQAKSSIQRNYQRLGHDWKDAKYLQLGRIVEESTQSLNSLAYILSRGRQALQMLERSLQEYEETQLSAYLDRLATTEPNVLAMQKDELIAAGKRAIEQRMEAVRDDLRDKGVEDPIEIERAVQAERDKAEIALYDDVFGKVEEQCAESLKSMQPVFGQEAWNRTSPENREKALNVLALKAGEAFRISIKGARFFDGPPKSRGYYSGDGYLYLNRDTLTDPGNRLDALDTVFHEGRHAFQEAACSRPAELGVTREQARIWQTNMQPGNYIQPEHNLFGYFQQPIEQDARDFAERIIENGGAGNDEAAL